MQTQLKTCTTGLADEFTDAVIRSNWANPAAVGISEKLEGLNMRWLSLPYAFTFRVMSQFYKEEVTVLSRSILRFIKENI